MKITKQGSKTKNNHDITEQSPLVPTLQQSKPKQQVKRTVKRKTTFAEDHQQLKNEILTPTETKHENQTCMKNWIDQNALYFGLRVSILLTISSFFIVIEVEGKVWPQASWILITVLFVSWFPRLDAASVIEKSIQRVIGTLTGGFFGLVCGVLSYQMSNKTQQVICLEVSFFIVSFFVSFCGVQLRVGRTTRVIDKYSYATILTMLTFVIALFPFYESTMEDKRDAWNKAMFRVINVGIGCFIGAVGSMVVVPKSTTSILQERIQKQCKLAGEASEAVLHASADIFSGGKRQVHLSEELLEHFDSQENPSKLRYSVLKRSFERVNRDILQEGGHNNIALEKYESALGDWKVTKGLFRLLKYDPFHCIFTSTSAIDSFRVCCATALSRALRIQTTVVLMDGIIRNDSQQFFSMEILKLFTEIGTLLRKLLTINSRFNVDKNESVKELLMERLALIRFVIMEMIASTAELEDVVVSRMDSGGAGGSIICNDGSNRQDLLFLQLVEHLALRCLALYDCCREVSQNFVVNSYAEGQKKDMDAVLKMV